MRNAECRVRNGKWKMENGKLRNKCFCICTVIFYIIFKILIIQLKREVFNLKCRKVLHYEEKSRFKTKDFEKAVSEYIVKDNELSLEAESKSEDGCILQSFDGT